MSARSATALLVKVLLFSAPLQAQGAEFSLGGGVGVPLGTYNQLVKIGWQGTAGVAFHPGSLPIGFQVDGTFAQFSDETPLDVKIQLFFGTANAVYTFASSPAARLRPYVIGGIGLYNSKASGDDAPEGSATEAGINLGAGFDIQAGAAGVFAEARWHNLFLEGANRKFIPITVGLRFGGR